MDMQVTTTSPAVSAGQGIAANQSGPSAGKTGLGLFAGILQAAAGTGSNDAGDGTDAISAELLASMGLTPQTLLLFMNQQQEGGEQTLLTKLLSALANDPKLAESLLKDKDMRDWMQDASALLNALAPTMQQISPGLLMLPSADAAKISTQDGDALKLQQTLLTLSTMLERQPDSPILLHVTAGLQKVLAPHMDKLNIELTAALSAQATDDSEALQKSKSSVQQITQTHQADGQGQTGNGKQSYGSAESKVQAASYTVQTTTVSKLEMLAAKSSLSAALLSGESNAVTSEKTESGSDNQMQNLLPGMPLHVALKMQQPVEAMTANVPTISAANFSEDMGQFFVKTMKVSLLSSGVSEATLSLQPQNLGNVDIKLTMQNGHLIAHIATQTAAAKDMLESQLPQLRMMLQNQGLQVEKLEVTQNSQASSSMFQDQGTRQQSFGREQSGGRNGSGNAKFGFEELDQGIGTIDSIDPLQVNGLGASFVATA